MSRLSQAGFPAASGYRCKISPLSTKAKYGIQFSFACFRFAAASGPNSISSVFSGCSSGWNCRVLLVGGNPKNLTQFYGPATGSITFGPHRINPVTRRTSTRRHGLHSRQHRRCRDLQVNGHSTTIPECSSFVKRRWAHSAIAIRTYRGEQHPRNSLELGLPTC